jgi:hypothetical protein
MKNDSLLKRVSELGFPLFETEGDQNANLTLADMAKSRDLRLWEGFPVVLANTAEKGLFNYERVNGYLKKPFDKLPLVSLMVMSLAVYRFFNLKFSWADKFYKSLPNDRKKEFSRFLEKLKNDSNFNVAGREMSADRLKTVFSNYFVQSQAKLSELLSVKDELSLEYSLSQVFSPKQKELFLKKLRREKLTKTENEYFSRVVKKKVLALANPELHHLAQALLK